jgi:hypothetical protein
MQQQQFTPAVTHIQLLPPGAVAVSAPMGFSDQPVHIQSALMAGSHGSTRPLSVRSSVNFPKPRGQGGVWTDAAAYGGVRPAQRMSAAAGQATSVEDILQFVRSLPRGSSVIAVVTDSLRYLDSRCVPQMRTASNISFDLLHVTHVHILQLHQREHTKHLWQLHSHSIGAANG